MVHVNLKCEDNYWKTFGCQLSELLESDRLTDLRFVTMSPSGEAPRSMNAHQFLFTSRSLLLKGLIEEAKEKQAISEPVFLTLPEIEPSSIQVLLDYFYLGIIDLDSREELEDMCCLLGISGLNFEDVETDLKWDLHLSSTDAINEPEEGGSLDESNFHPSLLTASALHRENEARRSANSGGNEESEVFEEVDAEILKGSKEIQEPPPLEKEDLEAQNEMQEPQNKEILLSKEVQEPSEERSSIDVQKPQNEGSNSDQESPQKAPGGSKGGSNDIQKPQVEEMDPLKENDEMICTNNDDEPANEAMDCSKDGQEPPLNEEIVSSNEVPELLQNDSADNRGPIDEEMESLNEVEPRMSTYDAQNDEMHSNEVLGPKNAKNLISMEAIYSLKRSRISHSVNGPTTLRRLSKTKGKHQDLLKECSRCKMVLLAYKVARHTCAEDPLVLSGNRSKRSMFHASGKIFKCSFCELAFGNPRSTKNHALGHFNYTIGKNLSYVPPFVCPDCKDEFSHRCDLLWHYGFTHKYIYKHTSEKDLCGIRV